MSSCSTDSDGRSTIWLCSSYLPTAAPTWAPTGPSVNPTQTPTRTPTTGHVTGYLLNTQYADNTCTTVAQVTVYKIGGCIPVGSASAEITQFFSGDGSSGTVQFSVSYYSDQYCTNLVQSTPNIAAIGCSGGSSWAYQAATPAVAQFQLPGVVQA